MAHIVGVPKREPCQKCSLPVFLAERLTIGKNVYHRTCLRCARCNSQLTPGSFYETENDGEYCCETCPDEEKKLDVASSSKDNNETFNRKSIAERLAFFEQDGSKVLQKSLSDEEKSQSLKKMNVVQFQATSYKPNTALNNFMSNHLSDTVDSTTAQNSTKRSSSSSTNTSTGSDTDDEQPPELPKSLPPSSLVVDISNSSSLLQSEASPESSLDNNLSVGANDTEFDNKAEVTSPNHEIPSMEKLNTEQSSPTPTYNNRIQNNVTKDSSEYDEQMRTIENRTSVDDCKKTVKSSDSDNSNTSNRSSMVRARLHQFEVIANKSQNSSISSISMNSLRTTKKLSIDESPNSLETEVPKNVAEHCQNDAHSLNVSPIENIFTNNSEETASYLTHENELKESTEKITEDGKPISQEMSKVENITISEEIAQTNLSADGHDSNETIIPAIVTLDRQVACESSSICDEQHVDILTEEVQENSRENVATDSSTPIQVSAQANNSNNTDEYPDELNPFRSDDDDDEKCDIKIPASAKEKRKSLNPFESCHDEVEKNSSSNESSQASPRKKISTNPFGSESEDDDESFYKSARLNNTGTPRRTPVPTPRNYRSSSRNPTPEPTPRTPRSTSGTPLRNTNEYYGSTSSLSFSGSGVRTGVDYLQRGGDVRGSGRSLASSSGSVGGTTKPRRKKAPAPPPPVSKMTKELSSALDVDSKKSSPGSSTATTPTPLRKKRPAPAPPSASQSDLKSLPTSPSNQPPSIPAIEVPTDEDKTLKSEPQIEKLCDEEKVLFENGSAKENVSNPSKDSPSTETCRKRLIALDASLIDDANFSLDLKEAENVVYRRTIAPLVVDDCAISVTSDEYESHDRQLEKLKDNKEAKNRNRQSQVSLNPEENDPLYNKSIHGKWKRRKGPAPALPIPPKKVLQMLPLQEIRHELEIIEVQQQGLEKQGVMLEKMIRERCEGPAGSEIPVEGNPPNSKEVEDLILQLFELVNEKNELFRRQAELMYLRRQHRLEQEQADLEYEIRVLMAQPERNKTDSDKAREEALIARLVEVVQLRNEVVECLEMDRLREAEEDLSIKQQLEMHSAKRDEELNQQTPTKLSKKEKKKQKELKKLGKSKKLDADKDADESEVTAEKQKMKKKKKKFLF